MYDVNELRRLLESLGPNEQLAPDELANVLGGPGTTRAPYIDMGDQPSRTADSQQNALLRILAEGDQPSRYAERMPAPDYGDQPSRTMGRTESGPVDLRSLPTDELRRAYAPARGGFVRNENSGETLFLNGEPGGISTRPYDQTAQPRSQQQRIKVAGYGDGIMSDLGETVAAIPAMDYSRPAVDTPKGRGYYGKDGAVYVKGSDGSVTKILQGYDRDASYVAAKRDFERRKAEQDILQSQAATEHTQEATEASRAQRAIKEDPFTQASLEKRYGKAEKGMQWTPDGKLVAMAGGSHDQAAQSAIEKGQDALTHIEGMIGKRDEKGQLVAGSKPHPGFEDIVGAKAWGGLPTLVGMNPTGGSDAASFKARLDQLKGGAFLEAYNSLKGGGAITEVEGKKATDAITRMDTAQSEKEFVAAAQEFAGVIQRGMAKAQQMRAPGASPAGAAPVSASQTGTIFSSLPDPRQYPGRRMATPDNIVYRSNGSSWVRE